MIGKQILHYRILEKLGSPREITDTNLFTSQDILISISRGKGGGIG